MSACVSPTSRFILLETRQRRVGFGSGLLRRESIFVFSRMRIREMERDGSPRRGVNNPRRGQARSIRPTVRSRGDNIEIRSQSP